MPISLPPVSRRRFIASVGAALLPLRGMGASSGEEYFAILNDTHIGAKQKPDSAIPKNLATTVEVLLKSNPRPAAVIINGDLAMRDGQPGDYEYFARLIRPLREGGIPVHLTMGNHDDREVFYRVLSDEKPSQPVVASRHVAIVEGRHASFFLLDSLKGTMITQGVVGAEQRAWLAKELDARSSKPAIVVAHHNPRLGGDPLHFPGGLEDSEELWGLFRTRKHVKAYIHGHIHDWSLASHEGVHIVNTPAVSYVANPALSTTGWTIARLAPDRMTVTTHTHQADHQWNGKSHELPWRS